MRRSRASCRWCAPILSWRIFSVLVGHQRQVDELRASSEPAVLVTGPSGVGKWLAVSEVARSLSRSVMEIREGGVTAVREAVDWLRVRPVADRVKVVLIDFDRLSVSGQNALLKTLEEPPAHARLMG